MTFSQICNLWVFMPIGFWCCFTWISVDGISEQLLQYYLSPSPFHFLPSGVSISMLVFFPVSLLLSHIINANRGAFADDTTNIGFIVVMLLCIPPPLRFWAYYNTKKGWPDRQGYIFITDRRKERQQSYFTSYLAHVVVNLSAFLVHSKGKSCAFIEFCWCLI